MGLDTQPRLAMLPGKENPANSTEMIFGTVKRGRKESRKTILLLGPKNCGKSSLINTISNYLTRVKESTAYRVHVIGKEMMDKESNRCKLSMEPTTSVNSYVFHGSRVSTSVALVDTPPLGEEAEIGADRIRKWYASCYDYPCKDFEVWLILSAQHPCVTKALMVDLRDIIQDLDTSNIKIVPVITFAKNRKPLLALKALEALGLPTDMENVDYFLVNNGSVVRTFEETSQTNALSFSDTMSNLRTLLITVTEPHVQIGGASNILSVPSNSLSISPVSASSSGISVSNCSSSEEHIYATPQKTSPRNNQRPTSITPPALPERPSNLRSLPKCNNMVSISPYETIV